MKRIWILALLVICTAALAGCGIDKDGAKVTGSGAPKAELCYGKDKNPCWVRFSDGMRCLASKATTERPARVYVYSECSGGAADTKGREDS
jgi:hypothetical protein